MGKMLGNIRRKNTSAADVDPQNQSPEAVVAQSVKSFCESSGTNSGDEVLYLPPIVEAAESSPQAAAECARLIRKYLKKDYWTRPSYQYNAIMLMRILADNPGPTFTRNMDQKAVDTIKELLRNGRDPSVQQMIMETMNAFEHNKSDDEGLTLLISMWTKEKEKAQKAGGRAPQYAPPQMVNSPPVFPNSQSYHSQNYFSRHHTNRRLPDPVELASRLEEARTSAKLLQEAVTNTPPGEVLDNEFMREFADRCTSASRSIQGYMTAENPSPDNDTMENLIDTNEQLQSALSLHQRAMLNARKHAGLNTPGETAPEAGLAPVSNGAGSSRRPSPSPARRDDDDEDYEPPPMPPRKTNGKGKEKMYEGATAGPSRSITPEEDPFRDPVPEPSGSGSHQGPSSGASGTNYLGEAPRLAYEPFHPGFNATPSYLGRQESSLGKETMHGGAGTASASKQPHTKDDDDNELYDATPQKSKEPMYRY
ncbi:hypothetical protein JX265_008230 [Neoarthrinium moseri]|uniref:GAT domain-containing protein n=1 Tax=Neoarthrinium moseri TaxID=1658444 RepID=A0A9P9WIM0_9PEZI|nr:uncharacterized protein JN550_004929 [Neoarthrinium moseri]KAI1851964.1 hypothetical protein JX266_002817 [Neoarthrinium moseri]KAI1865183.1 hypothetical protein JX265_008230 [Neoarthrinium moseri]KAI1870783.1 hypothetical protein JN550_004929 [Neoarthrinium moseri]